MSRFYGFPVFNLTGPEKLALECSRDVLAAEDELKEPVPDDRVYDLILTVTGSTDAAEEALKARIAHRLRSGEKAEV